MDALSNYAAFTRREVVVVFDGYRVPGGQGEKFDRSGLHVVFTRQGETADAYMEKLADEIGKNESVRVVTSDALIQLTDDENAGVVESTRIDEPTASITSMDSVFVSSQGRAWKA